MTKKQIREAARKYYPLHAGEVTMSSKRQITIPAQVVRDLELEPGVKLAVYVEGDEITLIPRKMGWFEYITTRPLTGNEFKTKEEVDAYLHEVREGWDEHARRFEGDSYVEDEEANSDQYSRIADRPSDSPIYARRWSNEEIDASIREAIEAWRKRATKSEAQAEGDA